MSDRPRVSTAWLPPTRPDPITTPDHAAIEAVWRQTQRAVTDYREHRGSHNCGSHTCTYRLTKDQK